MIRPGVLAGRTVSTSGVRREALQRIAVVCRVPRMGWPDAACDGWTTGTG